MKVCEVIRLKLLKNLNSDEDESKIDDVSMYWDKWKI